MAVSAADLRSALDLLPASAGAGPSQPKKATQSTRKPEGISRELYSLIGPSQPYLAAQLAKPRLKQKPKFAGGVAPATKWELRTFKNPARADGLELKHWVKASEDRDAEYPFAKYNIQHPTYTYSQEEYTRFLDTSNRAATPKDGKPDTAEKSWTKEWTDYLFKLYQEYDGRWHVIWDRAEFPPEAGFDLEDLKDRYYSVCRKLIRNRPWPGDEASRAALINSLGFDSEREKMRKRYLVSLESRTEADLSEEEALYIEIRRLEQTERKFKREREDLLRTLGGMDAGLPYLVEDNGTPLGIHAEPNRSTSKKNRKTTGMDTDSPSTPSGGGSSSSTFKRAQSTKASAAYDAQHCIIRTELSSNTPATKAAHHPAFIRSSKIPYLKHNSMQPKVVQCFSEMGLSPSRLVMPTKENVAQLEGLLEAVTAMLETKKHLDKVDQDILVLKKQLGMRTGEDDAGGGSGIKTEDTMDVDAAHDTETDGNEGRGHSVVSVRSGRSRKKSHRSMSVSSVDTTATSVSTRKRQKRS